MARKTASETPAPGTITSEVRLIYPEEALELTTAHKFLRQRPLDNLHATKLQHAQETGDFLQGTSVEIAVVGNRRVLTDGQHRLTAVFMHGKPQQFTIITRYCASWEEVDEIYYNTDAGKSRTLSDVLRAADLHKDTGLSNRQMKAVVSAAQWISHEVPGIKFNVYKANSSMTNDEKLHLLVEWADAATRFFEAIKGGESLVTNRLNSTPFALVGMLTIRHQEAKAREFWTGVAYNSGLVKGTPQHTLVRLLLENRINDYGVGIYARKIATCWNHFYQGTSITYLKGNYTDTPFILRGVEGFDGKK